jgi:hypothetical protein
VEEGGSGLGSEYEEEEEWRVLREERDELQTQLESLLDIDAAQRGLLQRLLDQLTRRDGKGEASAAADPSTDEVTSLQRLVEDSAEASLVVHLRHENLLLRQKLAARDGGKAGGGDSGGMPATSAEVVEGGTTLKEKQRKGKDKARSRTASTAFLDWPRRRGSSEASDAEEQQQARDENETVPSDASQKSSKKNARRSRTLSFLSKSSKSLDARSEANGAPLKGTADSADDDDKQSSQKGGLFKRYAFCLDRLDLSPPCLLVTSQFSPRRTDSLAGSWRTGRSEGRRSHSTAPRRLCCCQLRVRRFPAREEQEEEVQAPSAPVYCL